MADAQYIARDVGSAVRFRYQIQLVHSGTVVFSVKSTELWPGSGKQIFCLRDDSGLELGVEVERVNVIELNRIGAKLSFSLDRPMRKRAEFLTTQRPTKTGKPQEMIFFRTQAAIESHRSKGKVSLYGEAALNVVIDSKEKYPWTFPSASTTRRSLGAGDYALSVNERLVAVVERKTFSNLVSDLYNINVLHKKLSELGAYPRAAMVVEGQYSDLMDDRKIGNCKSTHLLRIIGELAALHPRVPIIWAGNRRDAAIWVHQYFIGAARHEASSQQPVLEQEDLFTAGAYVGGHTQEVRREALRRAPAGFSAASLGEAFPNVSAARIRTLLQQLRTEGLLETTGAGRGTKWRMPAA